MLYLYLIVFMVVLTLSAAHFFGVRRVEFLRNIPSSSGLKTTASIIVAARNEEKNIEKALRSLLAQDYAAKEIIVVNDRSTDGTNGILAALQETHPELRVIPVSRLPAGWLGKNHAHYLGARAAQGDVLLFTDADVVMAPSTLSRALNFMATRANDHLSVMPRVEVPGPCLNAIMIGFQIFFNLFTRAWAVGNPRSRAFVGIGAFNLIRREAYELIGTHQSIRLRPDDDMRLGQRIKEKGFRQGFLWGVDMVSVEWYDSVKNLIKGLMKNTFSAVNYHLSLVIVGTIPLALIFIFPFFAVFVSRGSGLALNFCSSSLLVICSADNARLQKQNPWLALGFPFTIMLMIYISWKAAFLTLWRGGIEWRGTFYPLKELRSNKV